MANELSVAMAYIERLLTGDGAVVAVVADRVWEGFEPDIDPGTGKQPVYPIVLFALQSGGQDTIGAGAVRVMANPSYQIKAVGAAGYEALQSLADRIDALFDPPSHPPDTQTVGGVTAAIRSHRDYPLNYSELLKPSGLRVYHLGGVYSFTINV